MLSVFPFLLFTACQPKEPSVPPALSHCETLGFVERTFDSVNTGSNYGEKSPDFTVETTEGAWTLSENWTGCDNYLFFNHYDGNSYAEDVWASDLHGTLTNMCLNIRALIPQKIIYVQETWKLRISHPVSKERIRAWVSYVYTCVPILLVEFSFVG